MTDRDAFLEVAVRIAGRIVAAATPEGDGCTWTVRVADRAHPERMETLPEPAGGQLYTGTAGIALFLAELHAAEPDAAVADAARGGIRHALASADALGLASFGFHAGRVGIAYAAARMGELMDDPALTRRAAEVLAPMRGHEAEDRGLDVIGGAAGAIPALLAMPPAVDPALRTEMAVALGDRLAAAAERGPVGWSWPTLQPTAVHNLCGYAHGAAGAGHAFLELFHATGEGRFLHGAEQAFLYERRWMSAAEGNWPDFRHVELGDHLVAGRIEELRARLRAGGTCAPYRPRYMSAWCHGAPGIGLSRLRAYQLLGDDVYRDEARVAVETTAATLADGAMNFSLCHGKAGNAETLLLAADVLGDDALRARVEAVARAGRDAFEAAGRPWPCGTIGGVTDPSLLLGEAGIGHFYLRLHSPAVPSVLLPVARGLPVATRAEAGEEYGRCRSRAAREWFGRSLAVMEAMGMTPPLPPARRDGAPPRDPVEEAHEALSATIGSAEHAARRELLEDASAVEREAFALACRPSDVAAEFVEGLARPREEEVRWDDDEFVLAARARLVRGRHDWDAWLAAGGGRGTPPPAEADVFHVLQSAGTRVSVRRVSPFAAAVLEAVARPAALDEVADHVGRAIAGDPAPDRAWLRERVGEQLRNLYRAGMVERAAASPAVAPATASA